MFKGNHSILSRWFGNPFANEFVVDEEPEDVVRLAATRKVTAETWRNRDTSNTGETARENPDLVTQISALLKQQERLEDIADELRQNRSNPSQQELARFFRLSLTLLDAFDRVTQSAEALPPSEETQNWLKSVASIQARMISLYEKFGLRAMDPVGKSVDLDRHEVIEVLRTDSIPDETVVEVRQKGYIFDNKVLRDAQVVVAKNERG